MLIAKRLSVEQRGLIIEMKKGLVTIACLVALSFAAIPVGAQTRSRWTNNRSYSGRSYSRTTAYNQHVAPYYDERYGTYGYDDRSRWEKSRDKITTAIGAGAGAVVGGLVGGKKGAILGAIAGGGGAAIYTYGIRDKDNRRRY